MELSKSSRNLPHNERGLEEAQEKEEEEEEEEEEGRGADA
jgi:hypothetical protein